jgi:hypothetical protein
VIQDSLNGLVHNGDFSAATNYWKHANYNTGTSTCSMVSGAVVIHPISPGNVWDIQLTQDGLDLKQWHQYQLIFDAKASANRPIIVNLSLNNGPFYSYLGNAQNLTTSWQTYTNTYLTANYNDVDVSLQFKCGGYSSDVYIDNVNLIDKGPAVMKEYITNGSFSIPNLFGWSAYASGSGSWQVDGANSNAHLSITAANNNPYNIGLIQENMHLDYDPTKIYYYQLKFDAKSSAPQAILVNVSSWDGYTSRNYVNNWVNLTTIWSNYSLVFFNQCVAYDILRFCMGTNTGEIYIDNVSITRASTNIYSGSVTAPTALTASSDGALPQVTLAWTETDSSIAGFNIYYSNVNNKPAAAQLKISPDARNTLVSGLNYGTTYYFWVEAYAGTSVSSSATAQATTTIPLNWTRAIGSAAFSRRNQHTSVVFNNKMWVIGGYGTSGFLNDMWNSSDGITWTRATASAAFSARRDQTSVVFNNKIWVIGGFSSSGMLNDVWNSSDGITWTRATASAAFPVRIAHTSVVFNNKIWVIGGYGSSSDLNDVWYSSDGITWTQATGAAAFLPRDNHTSVVFDNKMWVIGGYKNGPGVVGNFNDVWYSSDGVAWTQATGSAAFAARSRHTSEVYSNKMWVIGGGGYDGVPLQNDAWFSSDGVAWTRSTYTSTFTARDEHTSVVFNNKLWTIAGYPGTGITNDVWYGY